MITTYIPKSAVQKEAFPLAGMITFDDIVCLNGADNLLTIVNVFGVSERGKNLIKPDTKAASNGVFGEVTTRAEDFCGVTTRGRQDLSVITTRAEELPRQNRVNQLPGGLYATVRAREEGLSDISNGLNKGFSDISTASNEDLSVVTTREEDFNYLTTRAIEDFLTVTTRGQTVEVSLCLSHDGKKLVCRYFATSTHKAVIEFFESIKKAVIEFCESIKKGRTEFRAQYAHVWLYDYAEFSGTLGPEFSESIKKECARCPEPAKKNLPLFRFTVYGNNAPAKSGAGIGVLITCIVPARTKRVFLSAKFLLIQIMVGWMRLPKGRPVSIQAGYANLIQLTTSLRLASLGGEFKIHCIEAAIWLLPPLKNHLLSGVFTLASNPAISLLPLVLSQKHDLCYPIAHACLLLASEQGALMLKSYDVPTNPAIYTNHLISLAQLTSDVLTNDSAPDTDFLLALAFSIETVARDLHTMLESNELPEVTA